MSGRRRLLVPPPVPPGGRIAVIAPGAVVRAGIVRAGMKTISSWGYRPVPGEHLLARDGDLAGPDQLRWRDLEWALTDPDIDAVWAARGGWGTARLLSRIDIAALRRRPRWLIGFSDLTSLFAAWDRAGIAAWHGPLVNDLVDPRRFVASDLRRMLNEPGATLRFNPGARHSLVAGKAAGRLTGGCLAVLAALAGTAWQPDLRGAVVLLEEVGEPPYRLDRMLWQLRESGMLDGIAGLLFGQFVRCRPAPGRASRDLRDLLAAHAEELGVPALTGVPAGHGYKARALPLGYRVELNATRGQFVIAPPAARRR